MFWDPSSAEACLFLSEMYCLGEAPMDGPDYEKAEELRRYGMALYDYYRWDMQLTWSCWEYFHHLSF